MKALLQPTQKEIADAFVDITEPAEGVEIAIDWSRRVIWVNVDGVCALRICKAKVIIIDGGRVQQNTEEGK